MTVDMGKVMSVGRAHQFWDTGTTPQTYEIRGSVDGVDFSTVLVPQTAYTSTTFDDFFDTQDLRYIRFIGKGAPSGGTLYAIRQFCAYAPDIRITDYYQPGTGIGTGFLSSVIPWVSSDALVPDPLQTVTVAHDGNLSAVVYDSQGNLVQTLLNASPVKQGQEVGLYWDGADLYGTAAPLEARGWPRSQTVRRRRRIPRRGAWPASGVLRGPRPGGGDVAEKSARTPSRYSSVMRSAAPFSPRFHPVLDSGERDEDPVIAP
jgi:hypothetical protein